MKASLIILKSKYRNFMYIYTRYARAYGTTD